MLLTFALTAALAQDDFQREGSEERRAELRSLESVEPPALVVEDTSLESLSGNVVVIAFLHVDSNPDRRTFERLLKLSGEHGSSGLSILGVHAGPVERARLDAWMDSAGGRLPMAADAAGEIRAAFHVDDHPDLYLVDRSGELRIADLANSDLERAVQKLIGEPRPGAGRAELARCLPDTWPGGTYAYLVGGKRLGTVVAENRTVEADEPEEPEGSPGPLGLFELVDELRIGEHVTRSLVRCRPDADLTPTQWIRRDGPGAQRVSAKLTFDGGRITGQIEGGSVLRNLPGALGPEVAVARLAALVPFQTGTRYPFCGLGLGASKGRIEVERGRSIEFVGKAKVRLAEDDERETFLVVEKDGRRRVRTSFWFDEHRFLLKLEGETGKGKPFAWVFEPRGK